MDACRDRTVSVTVTAAFSADACRRRRAHAPSGRASAGRGDPTLDGLSLTGVVGIDMPLGLLADGWRDADALARRALGRRGVTVFAIPPRPVWQQPTYAEANRVCRELTGKGLSAQTWGLRGKLLEADAYRRKSPARLYEVHPELAFAALAGAPLQESKHTPAGLATPQGTPQPGRPHPARPGRRRSRERPPRRRRRRLVRPPHRRRRGHHPRQPRPARRRRHRNRHPLLTPPEPAPPSRAPSRPSTPDRPSPSGRPSPPGPPQPTGPPNPPALACAVRGVIRHRGEFGVLA